MMMKNFDSVLILNKGSQLYFGTTNNVITWLGDINKKPFDTNKNPLEHACSLKYDDIKKYNNTNDYNDNNTFIEYDNEMRNNIKLNLNQFNYQLFKKQFILILKRNYIIMKRKKYLLRTQIIQAVILSIFAGLLYTGIPLHQDAITARVGYNFYMMTIQSFLSIVRSVLVFTEQKALMIKEYFDGTYYLSSYFLANILFDLPLQLIIAFAFSTPGFCIMGLEMSKYLINLIIIVLVSITMNAVGLIISNAIPNSTVALMITPIFQVSFMIACGFFINLDSIPLFLWPIKIISPQKYAFNSLMANEFHNLELFCTDKQKWTAPDFIDDYEFCPFLNGNDLLNYFALENTITQDILILFLLWIIFITTSYIILRKKMNNIFQ